MIDRLLTAAVVTCLLPVYVAVKIAGQIAVRRAQDEQDMPEH